VQDAQNGHTVLPTNGMTATTAPVKPGAIDTPQVSGGQPGSGSLAQEPGGSKVGLVSVQPLAQVPESKVLPEYPVIALLKNIQGRVVIGAVIGKDGALQNVRLVGPPSILSAPVLEAVKKWHYQPRLQNGVPVEVETQITIDFEINAK
jgi:TonB family protein